MNLYHQLQPESYVMRYYIAISSHDVNLILEKLLPSVREMAPFDAFKQLWRPSAMPSQLQAPLIHRVEQSLEADTVWTAWTEHYLAILAEEHDLNWPFVFKAVHQLAEVALEPKYLVWNNQAMLLFGEAEECMLKSRNEGWKLGPLPSTVAHPHVVVSSATRLEDGFRHDVAKLLDLYTAEWASDMWQRVCAVEYYDDGANLPMWRMSVRGGVKVLGHACAELSRRVLPVRRTTALPHEASPVLQAGEDTSSVDQDLLPVEENPSPIEGDPLPTYEAQLPRYEDLLPTETSCRVDSHLASSLLVPVLADARRTTLASNMSVMPNDSPRHAAMSQNDAHRSRLDEKKEKGKSRLILLRRLICGCFC